MIDAISGVVETVADKFFPDANVKEEFKRELLKAYQSSDAAQIAVNQAEAQHKSLFVSGWRPFIGWGCGVVLIGIPLLDYLFKMGMGFYGLANHDAAQQAIEIYNGVPKPSVAELWPLLMGLLGLGGMRSWEKKQGVSTGALGKLKGLLK